MGIMGKRLFEILFVCLIGILFIYSFFPHNSKTIENYSDVDNDEELSLENIATKLSDKNATLYGAANCPYCIKQKEMFGDHIDKIQYVDCYNEDGSVKEE